MNKDQIGVGRHYWSHESAATFMVQAIAGQKVTFLQVPDDDTEPDTTGECSLGRFAAMMTEENFK